tara:strand:+ start:490 stop:1143 length:654 start_codon:yes stop_codon:yes gene_type:complete
MNKIINLFKNKEIEIESNVEKMDFNLISERIAETANKLNSLSVISKNITNKTYYTDNIPIEPILDLYSSCRKLINLIETFGKFDDIKILFNTFTNDYMYDHNNIITNVISKNIANEYNFIFYLVTDYFDENLTKTIVELTDPMQIMKEREVFLMIHPKNRLQTIKLYIADKNAIKATLEVLELKFGIDKKFIENLFSYVDKVDAEIKAIFKLVESIR